MNYKKFTIKDFVCDEYFQDWIILPEVQSDKFWNSWVKSHPDKSETIDQAKKFLLNIKFKEDIPTPQQVQNALARNIAEINAIEEGFTQTKVVSINRLGRLRKYAALFIAIVFIGTSLFYYNWRNSTITIATNYGEIKTIILPDSSEITMNSHSSISYLKHWRKDHPREVKMKGEVFFKIYHLNKDEHNIKDSERFIVSVSDLKVEVLGTTFEVKDRRGIANVILKSGKVKVAFNNGGRPDIHLLPGEMIAYETKTRLVKKSIVDIEKETAWVDKKIILHDASVNEIIEHIEDTYGYKVILKDTAIGNKKMEGVLFLDNLPDILFVLSTSLDIKIEKNDKDTTLVFSR